MTLDAPDNTGDAVGPVPAWALEGLSAESRECLSNLTAYEAPPLPDFGIVKRAAVLVCLFQRPGEARLRVLLTTRAKTLRRHPSQTALPGGKVDPEDPSAIHTARREAFEEVGLPPIPHRHIHHLTVLDPVLTVLPLNAHMKNHIVVIPVVCFLSDPAIIDTLARNPDEVDDIFTHPLRGCLDGEVDEPGLSTPGGPNWPFEEDQHSIEDRVGTTGGYRMHRFRTTHTPIKGLTSDILIHAAAVAYAAAPAFGRFAPRQPEYSTAIANVVLELPGVVASSQAEGLASHGRVLEWGGTEPGKTWRSNEVYDMA
ncbi:hypothetical protein Q5752_006224 [Cryptotrichosporon argae]